MGTTDRFRATLGTVKARAAVYKALGHPTRLFIVEELSHGERCVCELTAMVGADVSTVSKHLSVLRGVGLVEDEKRGAAGVLPPAGAVRARRPSPASTRCSGTARRRRKAWCAVCRLSAR